MADAQTDVLATVETALTGDQLKSRPRALLLLRLCQFSLLFVPDRLERYWSSLASVQGEVADEDQKALEELRTTMESASRDKVKGFAAEIIAEVEAAKELAASDVEQAKQRLQESEQRLRKRRWPFGKGAAWIALVEAWTGVDRRYALQLMDKVPGKMQDSMVQRLNRSSPLLAEEWELLVESLRKGRAIEIALEILEGDSPQLQLPADLIRGVGAQLRSSIQPVVSPQDEERFGNILGRYAKLVMSQVGGEQEGEIPTLLKELYTLIARTSNLDKVWPVRFNALAGLIDLGVNAGTLTGEGLESLLRKTPPYLVGFVRAHYAARTVGPGEVEDAYQALMDITKRDAEAEAWFLVTLVNRGLAREAHDLAVESSRSPDLVPRIRRGWLCVDPVSASSVVSGADMAGDPIGEFLAQGDVGSRVAYLREKTDDGARPVPGAMWAGAGTDEDPEGLRGFWEKLKSGQKSHQEIINEYLDLNPLYASYRRDTGRSEQFSEYLRIHGYGDYKYTQIDSALVETFVAWGDEHPDQVRQVLRAMWRAIQPDDNILMVDWLRNAILTRCRTVFATDPEVLIEDYLGWFTAELVKKGRVWQFGNRQVTLRYPPTSTFGFCLSAAATVSGESPKRRDEILLSGLRKFQLEPALVESAAQVYNSDKALLDLTPPVQLKPKLVESWQMGIVKNAIPSLLNAMAAQASS